MTDASELIPQEGIRYVLHNGLITGPMHDPGKGRFSAPVPGSTRHPCWCYWRSDGRVILPGTDDYLLLREYDPKDFPSTLDEEAEV